MSLDWSKVEWWVYGSPQGVRVCPRKLSGDGGGTSRAERGEHRAGEKFLAVVVGVSRSAVLAALKAGVAPAELTRHFATAAEEQVARSSRGPCRYRELLAAPQREEESPTAARHARRLARCS